MDKESTQTHQAHLDSLRGIAALIVVFTHYIGAFFPFAAFANQGVINKDTYWKLFSFIRPLVC